MSTQQRRVYLFALLVMNTGIVIPAGEDHPEARLVTLRHQYGETLKKASWPDRFLAWLPGFKPKEGTVAAQLAAYAEQVRNQEDELLQRQGKLPLKRLWHMHGHAVTKALAILAGLAAAGYTVHAMRESGKKKGAERNIAEQERENVEKVAVNTIEKWRLRRSRRASSALPRRMHALADASFVDSASDLASTAATARLRGDAPAAVSYLQPQRTRQEPSRKLLRRREGLQARNSPTRADQLIEGIPNA